jgi:hypothetical protein
MNEAMPNTASRDSGGDYHHLVMNGRMKIVVARKAPWNN